MSAASAWRLRRSRGDHPSRSPMSSADMHSLAAAISRSALDFFPPCLFATRGLTGPCSPQHVFQILHLDERRPAQRSGVCSIGWRRSYTGRMSDNQRDGLCAEHKGGYVGTYLPQRMTDWCRRARTTESHCRCPSSSHRIVRRPHTAAVRTIQPPFTMPPYSLPPA